MKARLFLLSTGTALAGIANAQPLLIGDLSTNGKQIVFTWASRLWTVPLTGGAAKLLVDDGATRSFPAFSPDGKTLAFTNTVDGEIYARGEDGAQKRLTYHPKQDFCRGWTPDGKNVLFASGREIDGQVELYTVGLEGTWEKRLPLPIGDNGSFSPDPNVMAYVPNSIFTTQVNRRFYRGGARGLVYTVDLRTGKRTLLSDKDSNSIQPRWSNGKVCFLNDRLASFNLTAYDVKTGKTRDYTSFREKGITSWSSFGNDGVFVQDGHLFRCALDTGKISPIDLTLDPSAVSKIDERKKKQVGINPYANSFMPSFDGKSVAIEARGEVMVWSDGGLRQVTSSSNSAERIPVLSPDGKRIAFFSDEGGEYRLIIQTLAGENKTVIQIEKQANFYRELEWSPDGKRLSFSDQKVSLWIADVAAKSIKKIDDSKHMAQGTWEPDWSPDSRWLAYAKAMPSRVRCVFLYDTTTGKSTQVTDEMNQSEFPVFDKSGRYLYFAGSANARNAMAHDIGWALMSDFQQSVFTTKKVCLVVLSKNDQTPLLLFSPTPIAGLEALLATPSTHVDIEGISRRIVPLNIAERNIEDLEAGVPGQIFIQQRIAAETPGLFSGGTAALLRYSLLRPQAIEKVVANLSAFEISGDGSRLLVLDPSSASLQDANAPLADGRPPSIRLDLSAAKIEVDLAAEWQQMYHEAFRMMRDYFYDPNHHGQDVAGLESHYAQFLPGIVRRADLNNLLFFAFGEVSVSHLRVGGGDVAPPTARPATPPAGLLGANYEIKDNRYRFTKILRNGDYLNDSPLLRAPLDQPGVDVRPGDYLIAVEGVEVTADKNLYSYFLGKANSSVRIKVAPSANGAAAREYTVVALAGENGLRRANWFRENREKVDNLSGGKIAYMQIGDHDRMGLYDFSRILASSQTKQGLIIDERFNPGGITADWQIEALLRKPMLAYDYRYGGEIVFPSNRIDGPKVLIMHERNGSAAETFALMFKAMTVGKTVGRPTYGGGIGVALYQQSLADNGEIGIPNRAGYNPLSGQWEIENEGVQPDVYAEITPQDFLAGRDSQLETAVRGALDELKTYRKPNLKKPIPPIHKGL